MARKAKGPDEDVLEDPPNSIDPYAILGLAKSASSDQVKTAYRKAALKNHPDKALPGNKDAAHEQFHEIAFAYAILSDERRRKRYDCTGSTSESLDLDDDDFNWTDFFREQTAAMVDATTIEKIRKEYQGGEQEKEDILNAYTSYEGDMDAVYEQVMCSNVLEDDERFRRIIDDAIEKGEADAFDAYAKEGKASKTKRAKRAKQEEAEARALAEELGVKDQLFGNSTGKKTRKRGGGEDELKALIQQRQKSRAESFMDDLEAKYGGANSKKARRKDIEEPSEEAFQRNAKKPRTNRNTTRG